MSLGRRAFIVGGGALICARPLTALGQAATASLLSPVPGKTLGFAVVREKSKIGEHVLTFEDAGSGNLTVRVAVELKVGLGPITLFRYKHEAAEVWQNGQLAALDTKTNDDGTPNVVTGRATPTGFMVEGTKASRYTAPADALPATHWNHKQLDGPWINTQDGRLLRPTITPKGPSAIPTASGATITANHFSTSGDAMLETWYDDTPNWAGLSFKAGDGSEIVYERM